MRTGSEGCTCCDGDHSCLEPIGYRPLLLNTLYCHLLGTCYSKPTSCDGSAAVPLCGAGLAEQCLARWPPFNSSFLLPFLQGPLWEQDHRPPPGCVWRPVHPTAPVRTLRGCTWVGPREGATIPLASQTAFLASLGVEGSFEARSLGDVRSGRVRG